MKRLLPIALLLLALAVLLIPPLLLRPRTGWIDVCVRSGTTDEPLTNALVVIPETGETYPLDGAGRTGAVAVPVRADERFSGILPMPWGEVTLLVYCDGYYPYALFHTFVYAGETRPGPTVHLFPDDGSLTEPFALIESPDADWTRELLDRFTPRG